MEQSHEGLARRGAGLVAQHELFVAHSVASSETQATVVLEGESFQNFDVVIGAAGLRSAVRREVDPTHSANTYAGYVTWRGLFPETSLPPGAAGLLLARFAFYTAPGATRLVASLTAALTTWTESS